MSAVRTLLALAVLSPVAAFVVGPAHVVQKMPSAAAVRPQMLVPAGPSMVEMMPTLMIAEEIRKTLKSEGDEVLEEIFINFPTAFAGFVITGFALQYAKELADIELPLPAQGAAVVGGGAAFVFLGKVGGLGGAAGILAKVSFDAWNLFAGLVLPGALLKY